MNKTKTGRTPIKEYGLDILFSCFRSNAVAKFEAVQTKHPLARSLKLSSAYRAAHGCL
jgi:hypothetical protein